MSILYEDGVELPSDIAGLVYTAIDPAGAWEFALLKELKNIGLTFDLEQARRLTLPSRADR